MFNQQPTNFLELIRKYSKHYPLNLVIINLEDNVDYHLNKDDEFEKIILIYDPRYKSSPLDYPTYYYCNTFEELSNIVSFMKKKHKFYLTSF